MTRRFPPDTLFAGLREPLRRALDLLSPHFPSIRSSWLEGLSALVRRRDEYEAVAGLALDAHRSRLEAGDFEAFTEDLQRQGHALATRGVAEEHAFLALARYLEECLACLAREAPGETELPRAVARLAAVAQLFLRSGYAAARSAGRQALDEQDRMRLARDLHDEIGHNLVVLKLFMEQMAADFDKGSRRQASRRLKETRALVTDAIASVRRVILDIGPSVLEELGLEQAVRLYARQFSARTGIEVQVVDASPPEPLPASHQTALYRVLQGALSNVAAHARASTVTVTLRPGAGRQVVMTVRDDGVGFEAERRAPAESFGLKTMRERMEALGGRFRVESRAAGRGRGPQGTTVEVELPLPPGET